MTGLDDALLAAVQAWGPAIKPVMAAFSSAGYGAIYMAVIAFAYWCVSPSHALRLSALLLLSSCLNTLVKIVILEPRPYWLRPGLYMGSIDTAAGMPSGHAQSAAAFWGLLATFSRRPWAWAACLLMIAGICVSRIYFGVHFASQIVAGLAVGLVLVWLFRRVEAPVRRAFLARGLTQQRLLLLAGWLSMMGLALALQSAMAARWTVPVEWAAATAALHPDVKIAPLQITSLARDISLLLGMLLGASALRDFAVRYTGLRTALARFVPGFAVFALFWLGTGALLKPQPEQVQVVADAVRGLLAGLWFTWWWPLLLQRLCKSQAI
jgi:membrane-associated phospholipid phosphatase